MDTAVTPDVVRQDRAIDWVARARALRPLIEAASPRTEAARELAPEVVEAFHAAGMFRLLIPRELGGAQLDLPTFLQVVEAIGQADGSVAWCLAQGSGCSFTSAYLAHDAAWRMFGSDPRAVLAWGAGVSGRAVASDGGWRVSGRWGYNSGSRHANWLGGLCPLVEADGTPRREADGAPMVRSFVFPKAQATVIDDWHVSGLRGTGSDTCVVNDVFVPDAYCFLRSVPAPHPDPQYRLPLMHVYPVGFAGVALGLARAIQDAFIAMARDKVPRGAAQAMRDNAAIQSLVGQSETRLRSARCYVLQTVREITDDLNAGLPLSEEHVLSLRMATTFAIHESVTVADVAWHEAGASAIHIENPFERRWRDLHAVAQQVQARRANFELVGARLLGVATGPLFI